MLRGSKVGSTSRSSRRGEVVVVGGVVVVVVGVLGVGVVGGVGVRARPRPSHAAGRQGGQ